MDIAQVRRWSLLVQALNLRQDKSEGHQKACKKPLKRCLLLITEQITSIDGKSEKTYISSKRKYKTC